MTWIDVCEKENIWPAWWKRTSPAEGDRFPFNKHTCPPAWWELIMIHRIERLRYLSNEIDWTKRLEFFCKIIEGLDLHPRESTTSERLQGSLIFKSWGKTNPILVITEGILSTVLNWFCIEDFFFSFFTNILLPINIILYFELCKSSDYTFRQRPRSAAHRW